LGKICSQQFVLDSGDSGWSEFEQTGLTIFGIDSGIDLIVKTNKKKISKLTLFLGTTYLLHHNPCVFLWIWRWKDT